MTVETTSVVAKDVHYRQVTAPSYLTGTFTQDDTDNHDFILDARGKGRLTVAVNNPGNQSLTFTVYGMHASGGTVGDAGTFVIGAAVTVANAAQGYEVVNDPFPWYLVRIVHAVAPTDDPAKTCTLYASFSAF